MFLKLFYFYHCCHFFLYFVNFLFFKVFCYSEKVLEVHAILIQTQVQPFLHVSLNFSQHLSGYVLALFRYSLLQVIQVSDGC